LFFRRQFSLYSVLKKLWWICF